MQTWSKPYRTRWPLAPSYWWLLWTASISGVPRPSGLWQFPCHKSRDFETLPLVSNVPLSICDGCSALRSFALFVYIRRLLLFSDLMFQFEKSRAVSSVDCERTVTGLTSTFGKTTTAAQMRKVGWWTNRLKTTTLGRRITSSNIAMHIAHKGWQYLNWGTYACASAGLWRLWFTSSVEKTKDRTLSEPVECTMFACLTLLFLLLFSTSFHFVKASGKENLLKDKKNKG